MLNGRRDHHPWGQKSWKSSTFLLSTSLISIFCFFWHSKSRNRIRWDIQIWSGPDIEKKANMWEKKIPRRGRRVWRRADFIQSIIGRTTISASCANNQNIEKLFHISHLRTTLSFNKIWIAMFQIVQYTCVYEKYIFLLYSYLIFIFAFVCVFVFVFLTVFVFVVVLYLYF